VCSVEQRDGTCVKRNMLDSRGKNSNGLEKCGVGKKAVLTCPNKYGTCTCIYPGIYPCSATQDAIYRATAAIQTSL
jgi:hypothetical protein